MNQPRIMNWVLYGVSVCALLGTVAEFARKAAGPLRPTLVCLLVASLLYLAMLIPASLGVLWPVTATATLLVLCSLVVWRSRAMPQLLEVAAPEVEEPRAVWLSFGPPLAFAAGVVLSAPLVSWFAAALGRFADRDRSLPWDVVSYHLPALIEIFQTRSLWSTNGPYQSYHFAAELVAGFPALFFPSTWWWELSHLFVLLWLLSAVWALGQFLASAGGVEENGPAVLVLTIGLCNIPLARDLTDVGKNDVFVSAALLTSLLLLIDWRTRIQSRLRFVFATLALALAIGAKPHALAYLPSIGLAAALCPAGLSVRSCLRAMVVVAGGLVGGGVFMLRNLIAFGSLTDPALGSALGETVLALLLARGFEATSVEALVLVSCCVSVGLSAVWFWVGREGRTRRAVAAVFAFLVVGLASFVVVPYGIGERAGVSVWNFRLAMPVLFLAGLLLSVALVRLSKWLGSQSGSIVPRLAALTLVGCLMPVAALQWDGRGVSGWEEPKGLARTDIYRWLDEVPGPSRIYSAGLRPQGLFGPAWENRVFYDLHSIVLEPDDAGRARMASVLRHFRPELVLVAVDPHWETGKPRKPLVDWLRAQPCLDEVYSDWVASAFRVDDTGCADLIAEHYAAGSPPPRMWI